MVEFEQRNISWAAMIYVLLARGLDLSAILIKNFEKFMLKSIAWTGSA